MNKRGSSVLDFIFIVAILLSFGMVAVFGWQIWSSFDDTVQSSDFGTQSKEISTGINDKFVKTWDTVALVTLILFVIGTLVAGFLLDTHPAFFIIGFILSAFVILIAAILGNVYSEFAAEGSISAYSSDFVIIPFIFENIVAILVGMVALLLIALYAKNRRDIL